MCHILQASQTYKKRHILLTGITYSFAMSANAPAATPVTFTDTSVHVSSISSEFDVFTTTPVESAVLGTTEITYKPIASVVQRYLEFFIPSDKDTYIDHNTQLYVRGKLVAGDRKDMEATDHTAVIYNFLHSLFSQYSISLNGVAITQASEL
jgi:hypothetical protein